jgi:hypothetical protein
LRVVANGAQRASRRNRSGSLLALMASILAVAALVLAPASASAAVTTRVVIVVGPVEGTTAKYIQDARQLAAQARSYGATVTEIYSPHATWAKVKPAAQHANVLIYLGHGNGTPSPYPYSPMNKNGMGLNALANHGNSNVKYYGQAYMKYIHLAPNAVVILNHLCYSAGNSEPGNKPPTTSVAKQRIDNFAASFLKTGARAVFAEPKGAAGYILTGLFTTSKTLRDVFKAGGTGTITYASKKTPGATTMAKLTVRAVTGFLDVTAADFRAAGGTP